jgi:hypothetical protein
MIGRALDVLDAFAIESLGNIKTPAGCALATVPQQKKKL